MMAWWVDLYPRVHMGRRAGWTVAAAAVVWMSVVVTTAAVGAPNPVTGTHPKLAPVLNTSGAIDGGAIDGFQPQSATPQVASDAPLVEVQGDDLNAVTDAVTAAGGQVRLTPPGAVLASVPRANLGALSDDARVRYVTLPRPVQPDATSEGVDNPGPGRVGATGARAWQDAGRRGAGVKVAIVDVGFDRVDSEIAAGRLPPIPAGQRRNFCGNGVTGFDGRGPAGTQPAINHGTAVAEIVHQMAPDAILYLVCIYSSSDGRNVEQYLASQGITVVNASIGDLLDGRGDGTGDANSLTGGVAAGRQAGQLWSVSAGNDALRHYTFTGKDADNDGQVEMFSGTPVLGPLPDSTETYSFTLANNQKSVVDVKWDAWPTTNQGFKVCFYQDTIAGAKPCPDAYSQSPSGKPIQQTQFTNSSGSSHTYLMVIERVAGTTITPRFDVWFEGSEQNLQSVSAAGSLTEPATSPYAMTLGAHNFSSGQLESFSSQGPTIDGRRKPDLSGPDGVSNDVLPGFFGTSAAAPHATGAAALVKGVNPAATPDQIQSILLSRAVDAGPPGPDNQYGGGRLNLGSLTFLTGASSGPSEVSSTNGRTDVFVIGTDGGLWQRTRVGSSASAWLALGGFLTSDPDVSSWGGGRLDVFARGGDNALWHRSSNDGSSWSDWESLGGVLTSGPAAVSSATNGIDLFVRGGDGALWTKSWNGSGWSGWSSLGGFVIGDPDVASWSANRLDLFARGGDDALWHQWRDGAQWSGWQPLGGILSSSPGTTSSGVGRVEVGVRGGDNALWLLTWNGASWSGWSSLGGGLASAPDLAQTNAGQLDVVAHGNDSAIWQQSFNGSSWLGWISLGPP